MARECGECTVCCEYFPNPATSVNRVCQHLGKGCMVHDTNKPAPCVAFRCGWLLGAGGEDDRPDKGGVLILPEGPGVSKERTYKVSDLVEDLRELRELSE